MAADDGAVTKRLIEAMEALAKGGVGLIISSHSYASPEGQAAPRQIGVYKDGLIPGLKEMTTAVHAGGGKIIMQLSHAGKFAPEKLTGRPPLVVSNEEEASDKPDREITKPDIAGITAAFADAAGRAKAAGFDGVQIHAAHGYLLSQFLSPIFNRRRDEYGGDIWNRSRALVDVYQAVREAVGKDYPVLVKLNCRDFAENGLTLDDAIQVGKILADIGIDAIELSGGLLTERKLSPSRPGIRLEEDEAYHQDEARSFKDAVIIPLILVGGIRSFQTAERLVQEGTADYISMSRPFIREPGLINRWRYGDRLSSGCKSDNRCLRAGMTESRICCETLRVENEQ
jgi:2,4-dienoyl-CoA reductase-like NADH-dependent reductase (Old Yellow Enzyme family)